LKADGPYWEAVFENRVAAELQNAGYGIRWTAKGWEVAGILKAGVGGGLSVERIGEALERPGRS
jgi:hypothetical protein